jgi:hypothetical protein
VADATTQPSAATASKATSSTSVEPRTSSEAKSAAASEDAVAKPWDGKVGECNSAQFGNNAKEEEKEDGSVSSARHG